eukprot:Em0011g6a
MAMCVLPDPLDRLREGSLDLIDEDNCNVFGSGEVSRSKQHLQAYPMKNIMFYTQIPSKLSRHVMSRWFQFLITDLGMQFSSGEYAEKVTKFNANKLRFEIALGYRDDHSGSWHHLTRGNVSRTLSCRPNAWGIYSCDHFPLFELGSCHHQHYLINIVFPSLPLGDIIDDFRGLAPLSGVIIYEVHQTVGFTRLWFTIKAVLFPVVLVMLCWLMNRMSSQTRSLALTEKSLVFMGISLTVYNAPVELLSLYIDAPWLLVLNDFRQGVLIASLFSFWIILVGEHKRTPQEWLFIGIALLSSLLYAFILVIMVIGAYNSLLQKHKSLVHMSLPAKLKFESLFIRWKFFLCLTIFVAVMSVGSLFLPATTLLYWQQGKSYFSYYS